MRKKHGRRNSAGSLCSRREHPRDDTNAIEVLFPRATSKCKFAQGILSTRGTAKFNYSFCALFNLVELIEKHGTKFYKDGAKLDQVIILVGIFAL